MLEAFDSNLTVRQRLAFPDYLALDDATRLAEGCRANGRSGCIPSLSREAHQNRCRRRLQHQRSLGLLAPLEGVLRRTIIDGQRQGGAQQRLLRKVENELASQSWTEEEEREACQCLQGLVSTLKPEYALVIKELDLAGTAPSVLAHRLGITTNNLKVRRHRARAQLRKRLEETCRVCARHGCLDCTCSETVR